MKSMFLIAIGLSSISAHASSVSFDLARGVAMGSGCEQQGLSQASRDLRVLSSQRYLAIVTRALSINLSDAGADNLAERKNCSIRIPAKVRDGFTIKTITQRLNFGVYKTDGATAAVSARAVAINTAAPLTRSFDRDSQVDQGNSVLSSKIALSAAEKQSLCNEPSYIQKIDLSASAQLFAHGSQVEIGRHGTGDVKIEVIFDLEPCASLIRL